MKLILIGQSSEVGKQGWTWDEMNNCSLMFIGDAIGTAIKHADDMGWSQEMKTKIPSIYAKVSEFFQGINADIPPKKQYRLALLVDGMKYDFVEIPPALEGELINNKSWLVSAPWQSKAIKEGQNIAWMSRKMVSQVTNSDILVIPVGSLLVFSKKRGQSYEIQMRDIIRVNKRLG
jgi:hypothetical protein